MSYKSVLGIPFSRFSVLYGGMISLLIMVLLAAFVFKGILAWTTGLLYIAYDSFILYIVVAISADRKSTRLNSSHRL